MAYYALATLLGISVTKSVTVMFPAQTSNNTKLITYQGNTEVHLDHTFCTVNVSKFARLSLRYTVCRLSMYLKSTKWLSIDEA